jgi:spermidine synthase
MDRRKITIPKVSMPSSKLEILAYEDTPLGPLCLRRRELLAEPGTFVTEVTLNHEFLMSSYNTHSERAISNRSIELHGDSNLKTLVGGLGLGYTARELISNEKVATVEVVEFLPQVIDWLRNGLVPLSTELNAAKHLQLTAGDVYQRLLAEPSEHFDLIVIDVDHSPSDQLGEEDHTFYTARGLQQAKMHLREGGILAVWSYAESSSFADALHSTFDQVHVEPIKTVNTLVGHEQTDWLFFGVR